MQLGYNHSQPLPSIPGEQTKRTLKRFFGNDGMGRPWMKFYPTDWRADPSLRMCSIAARGLWMEMLCVMHEATPRGWLLVNGNPITDRQIASLVGASIEEVAECLSELEHAGVFSRDAAGVIFSRRMHRDEEKSALASEYGSRGGNPSLTDKPRVKGRHKPQIPDTRYQKIDDDAREPSISSYEEAELREAAGKSLSASPSLFAMVEPLKWKHAGMDWGLDVLPAIRNSASRAKEGRIQGWGYFSQAIADWHERRTAPMPKGRAPPPSTSKPVSSSQGMINALAKYRTQPAGEDRSNIETLDPGDYRRTS